MAKGNLLLGTAGNSVGDVVMYRREGAQVSRVRVRKIKNPKTDAQSLQRAAFSPVAKFYSPLAVVLERSFEGLSKMKSYNKFLKTNIDLARTNGWLLPKGTGFFPLPYKLSQGTLKTVGAHFNNTDFTVTIQMSGSFEAPATIGDMSELFVGMGYSNGDIVTIIGIAQNGDNGYYPISVQFEIDTTSVVTLATAIPSLTIQVGQGPWLLKLGFSGVTLAGGAIIVARFENEKWRRSTEFLAVSSTLMTQIEASDYKAAAIASYGMNAGDPNALVYLDGDTLEG